MKISKEEQNKMKIQLKATEDRFKSMLFAYARLSCPVSLGDIVVQSGRRYCVSSIVPPGLYFSEYRPYKVYGHLIKKSGELSRCRNQIWNFENVEKAKPEDDKALIKETMDRC
jgi:hypothetical protein